MADDDDPFLRMLKDAARDLGVDLPGEVFGDSAAREKWLRDHGFPAPEPGASQPIVNLFVVEDEQGYRLENQPGGGVNNPVGMPLASYIDYQRTVAAWEKWQKRLQRMDEEFRRRLAESYDAERYGPRDAPH